MKKLTMSIIIAAMLISSCKNEQKKVECKTEQEFDGLKERQWPEVAEFIKQNKVQSMDVVNCIYVEVYLNGSNNPIKPDFYFRIYSMDNFESAMNEIESKIPANKQIRIIFREKH